jgi:HEPN domain-containing protein
MGLFCRPAGGGKGGKTLHLANGQEAWGHMVAKLLSELPEGVAVPDALIDKGRVLDASYIPSRYPDSYPEGAPFEHFGPLQSEETLRYAGEIITFVREKMA